MDGIETKRLDQIGEVVSGATPSTTKPDYWDGEIVWITPNDLSKLGTPYLHTSGKLITEKGLNGCSARLLPPRSITISSRAPIGYVAIPTVEFCTNQGCKSIELRPEFDSEYTYYNICFHVDELKNIGEGTTFSEISKSALAKVEMPFITDRLQQTQIATILSTIDKAIEQTEAIIAKQQRIKTGLMQDLLTRGIDKQGNLRSEETHEFKDSPLGRIPVEWDIETLGNLVESAVDGPFGSNLKTEHYVSEPGVRVLRLQNIGSGEFFDFDKAWVSSLHAKKLTRHSVIAGDILVASLGDERHPFCRACLYPDTEQPAIVKADVFRIRCNQKMISHSFIFRLFNMPRWRGPLLGLVQGVTRDRVNLSNLMLLPLPVPDFDEQKALAKRLDSVDNSLVKFRISREKLHRQKTALMQDLLTGKVRVTALLEAEAR